MSKAPGGLEQASGSARKARERKKRVQARHVTWLADLCNSLASHHTFAEGGGKAWALVTTLREELDYMKRRVQRLEHGSKTGTVQAAAGAGAARNYGEEVAHESDDEEESPGDEGTPQDESAEGSEHQGQMTDGEDLEEHDEEEAEEQDSSSSNNDDEGSSDNLAAKAAGTRALIVELEEVQKYMRPDSDAAEDIEAHEVATHRITKLLQKARERHNKLMAALEGSS